MKETVMIMIIIIIIIIIIVMCILRRTQVVDQRSSMSRNNSFPHLLCALPVSDHVTASDGCLHRERCLPQHGSAKLNVATKNSSRSSLAGDEENWPMECPYLSYNCSRKGPAGGQRKQL